ncbi:MAG: hypothetical protein J5760_04400, partial [Clostridia bacterium]|nr:hypothetical protein [Clostridia bacterium]
MELDAMKKPRNSREPDVTRAFMSSRAAKKPLHFRDEIRTAFISYAFIPVAALFILITLCAGIIWSVGINRKAQGDCLQICAVLEEAVQNYMQKAAELSGAGAVPGENTGSTMADKADGTPSGVASDGTLGAVGLDIPRMKIDKTLVSEAYSALKEFSRKQSIAANFAMVDEDFSVLLQGDSSQTFRIPAYQKEIGWGPLQRMAQNPGKAVLEISHEYSASALDEIIIGSAVTSGAGASGASNTGGVVASAAGGEVLESTESGAASTEQSGYLIFAITGNNVQDALRSISSP